MPSLCLSVLCVTVLCQVAFDNGAESSEGRSDNSPQPTLPAHPPRSQLSQLQKLHQSQAATQEIKMPHTQLEAVRDVQADILSTLKDTSYFTNLLECMLQVDSSRVMLSRCV